MNKDSIVCITGSGGRLGSAFAKAIVEAGGKVCLGDNDAAGKERAEKLPSEAVFFRSMDVTTIKSIRSFIDASISHFGRIDAFVHCAYPKSDQWGKPFGELSEEGLKVDLYGQLGSAILVSQEIMRYFQKEKSGHLIHISSIQGLGAPKFDHYENTDMVSPIEYSAIKSGVIAITRYLAKMMKGQNIRVNCISPGGISDGQSQLFTEKYKQDCLNKGLLDSNDICGALLFLLSEQSKFINGQNIVIDDGWSL